MMLDDDSTGSNLPDDVFDALAQALAPAQLPAARQRDIRRRVVDRLQTSAAPGPAATGLVTVRVDAGDWQSVLAGVELKVLHDHGTEQSFMLRLAPGAVLAQHHHAHEELCVVLEGSAVIGGAELGAGTYHLALAGSDHATITTRTGCLLFLRAPLDAGLAF